MPKTQKKRRKKKKEIFAKIGDEENLEKEERAATLATPEKPKSITH